MNKYVRTDDGVYSLGDKEIDTAVLTNHGWAFKRDIIKQTDNLEELCDEFVLGKTEYFQKPCVTKLPLDFLRECVIKNDPYDLVVYGAIWTEKGLIYVAKMNEKGELELL